MTGRSFISDDTRNRVRGYAVPLATAIGRTGITPNGLTVIGFLGAVLTAILAGLDAWVVAGITLLFFGAFDMLDGALARATGRVSKFGGFLDSSLDRAGELVIYVGIGAGAMSSGTNPVAVLASLTMAAAVMVSYTRARAESLGFRGDVGVAPRAERVALLGLGLIATGIGGGPAHGPWLALTLGIILALSTITVLQRILVVRAQSRQSEVESHA